MKNLAVDELGVVESWNSSTSMLLQVSVDASRLASLDVIPTGTVATDYEFQFRPAPLVKADRSVDMSVMLDETINESVTAYEYQLR